MKIKLLFILTTFFLNCNSSFSQSENAERNIQSDSIEIDNVKRSYSFFVPKGIKESPHLVFILHGARGSGKRIMKITGYEFNSVAINSKNSIIVYPEGYDNNWNDCIKASPRKTKQLNIDEAVFFKTMIHKFKNGYRIDTSKVFIVGFSNGAHMVYKLAMQEPDLFKGFAAISGNIPTPENNDCFGSKSKSVSMLIANGTSDPIIPYEGGYIDGKTRGEVISTLNTVKYWTDLLECDKVVSSQIEYLDLNNEDNSTAKAYEYICEKINKKVKYIEIKNGGHTIPNPNFDEWSDVLGNVNKDINLPFLILEFFNSLK